MDKSEVANQQSAISVYSFRDFTDLCRGPHVESSKELPRDGFKIRSVAGAYWKGDSNNKMHETENAELLKKLLDKDSIVSIPSEYNYLFSDYSSFSGTEASLRIGEKVKLHPIMAATSATRLPPNCKLTQDRIVYQDKVTATYSIRFVSQKDWSEYKEIQGKWTGVFFRDMEEDSVVEEIGVE